MQYDIPNFRTTVLSSYGVANAKSVILTSPPRPKKKRREPRQTKKSTRRWGAKKKKKTEKNVVASTVREEGDRSDGRSVMPMLGKLKYVIDN